MVDMLNRTPALEALSSTMNTNYNPARPWTCQTHADHACSGPVVGKVGAYPVCQNGATAEIADRIADAARIAALMDTPEMRREIAWEIAWERRVS